MKTLFKKGWGGCDPPKKPNWLILELKYLKMGISREWIPGEKIRIII